MNSENINLIIGTICKKNKYNTTDKNRIFSIFEYIKTFNIDQLSKKYNNNLEKINNHIINNYKTYNVPIEQIDLHDTLAKMLKSNGDESKYEGFDNNNSFTNFNLLSEQDKLNIARTLNYESTWRDEFINIDSRYQNLFNQDKTKLSFNIQSNTKTKTASGNGAILTTGVVRDVIQIEIYPFSIPYKPTFDNFYKQISMTIIEWGANIFEAYEDSQFHFALDIDKIEDNKMYLVPVNNIFRFYKPVNYISDFTLTFGAFLPRITFDEDRMNISSIDYTSKLGVITFASNHNLITGDLVYISDFTSLTPAQNDTLLNEINRASGHNIVKKNNTQIMINIDFSPMRYEDPIGSNIYPIDSFVQNPMVYFGSKRISIKMRIRYLLNTVNV